jgi:hypothetical protein
MDAYELTARYDRYWNRSLRARVRRLRAALRPRKRCGDFPLLPPPQGLAGVPARLPEPRPGAGGAAAEP